MTRHRRTSSRGSRVVGQATTTELSATPRLALASLLIGLVVAVAPAGSSKSEPSSDGTTIRTLMHGLFDKPGSGLDIDPIVVEGDFAVAGWTQGDTGGRAFLRRRGASWTLALCSGDEIKSASALRTAGVPDGIASRLADAIDRADRALSPARRKALASFKGLVPMAHP